MQIFSDGFDYFSEDEIKRMRSAAFESLDKSGSRVNLPPMCNHKEPCETVALSYLPLINLIYCKRSHSCTCAKIQGKTYSDHCSVHGQGFVAGVHDVPNYDLPA